MGGEPRRACERRAINRGHDDTCKGRALILVVSKSNRKALFRFVVLGRCWTAQISSAAVRASNGLPTCELVHNRAVRIELNLPKQDLGRIEMAQEAGLTIPIAIFIVGIVYLVLLYSVVWYL
jgi:hypothetical protein